MLHSVHHALSSETVVFTNDLAACPSDMRYEDWQLAHQTCGAVSFVTVPLLFGGWDLGALVASSTRPGCWDEAARKLLIDFGLQISQALYTRATQAELAAGGCMARAGGEGCGQDNGLQARRVGAWQR